MCGTHHESPDEDEMSGTSWNRREGGPAAKDPFASDLHMHPSDWERVAEGRDKLRERREEIVRAFDSAMAYFGRDREHVAERLAYIVAAAMSAAEGLGLDAANHYREEVPRG